MLVDSVIKEHPLTKNRGQTAHKHDQQDARPYLSPKMQGNKLSSPYIYCTTTYLLYYNLFCMFICLDIRVQPFLYIYICFDIRIIYNKLLYQKLYSI